MSKKRPEIVKEYMEILRPCLHFHGIQIKSVEAFRRFANSVSEIEEICGVHEVVISLEDIFVCPWIHIENLETHTAMEELLKDLIIRICPKS